jgi:hypothetical protein
VFTTETWEGDEFDALDALDALLQELATDEGMPEPRCWACGTPPERCSTFCGKRNDYKDVDREAVRRAVEAS